MGRQPDAGRHVGDDRVEQRREVGRGVGVDRRRRLVDLDERGALGDERTDLGGEDRDERLGRGEALRIDAATDEPARQRERPRQRHLERPSRARPREAELLDDPEPVGRSDGFEHLEAVLLVVAGCSDPALGLERAQTREVAIELGGEEARAAHLAVGHDVDAGLLLVAQRGVDGVVLELGDVGGPELAATGSGDADDQPRRVSVRADDTRRQVAAEARRGLRHAISAKANARAGLVTKISRWSSASMPRTRIASANSPSRNAQPGDPP